jgi:hypothetical protein
MVIIYSEKLAGEQGEVKRVKKARAEASGRKQIPRRRDIFSAPL